MLVADQLTAHLDTLTRRHTIAVDDRDGAAAALTRARAEVARRQALPAFRAIEDLLRAAAWRHGSPARICARHFRVDRVVAPHQRFTAGHGAT
ncbi:hypothetical protein GKZ92_23375 (plasmid) [Gordonia sp. 135]|uniref:hypothetical protein n=1 Tax=Gordonia sp. 135 TaxID=2676309 RepID=UPI0012BB3230|nr:hypothetical protein [Gordonia sp. 135]QGP90651.1 hypothetical protein GKZ92_23375 [Gordonia sp. 135]